jgi:predicted Fe-Mo cluster-binding NifX family protein
MSDVTWRATPRCGGAVTDLYRTGRFLFGGAVSPARSSDVNVQWCSTPTPRARPRRVGRPDAAYAEPVNIAVATDPAGNVGHSWGKARTVAVAHITHGRIERWDEFDVGWDQSHDSGTHGSHHATVARFLKEHEVTVVLVNRVGDGMARMLHTMGVRTDSGVTGDARAAVERAAIASP